MLLSHCCNVIVQLQLSCHPLDLDVKDGGKSMTKERERRMKTISVIAIIWQSDIRDWEAATLWLYISDKHKPWN